MLLFIIARYFFYGIILLSAPLLITWEAQHGPQLHLFGEDSMLERMQLILLFATFLCAGHAWRQYPATKVVALLILGASTLAFIRECDAILDRSLFDGAWQLFATIVIILTIAALRTHRHGLPKALIHYSKTPSFGIMVSGFMTVFVFSRIIGRQALWKMIMGEGYMRVVKISVEESIELMGYTLIFIAALELLSQNRPTAHLSQD